MTEGGLIAFSGCGNYMVATRIDDKGQHFSQAWKLEKPHSRDLGTFKSVDLAHNACEVDESRAE